MRFLALVFISVCILLSLIWACPFPFPVALFAYSRHPDLPRGKFLDGQLGLLQPEFDVHYLVVAYRHLAGAGLNWAEKEQVLDYWRDIDTAHVEGFAVDWAQRWDDVVRKYPDLKPNHAETNPGSFDLVSNSFTLNCAEDAFRTAQRTWQVRSRQLGARSPVVRDWVAAQIKVFAHCSSDPGDLPPALPANALLLARQDRDYQIAAAHFYGFHWKEAGDAFRRIAADPRSPWSRLSAYLVVRGLIREGFKTQNRERFREAAQEGKRILQTPSLYEVHSITKQALHRAGVAYGSEEFVVDLARTLSRPGLDRSLRQDLYAFQQLYRRDSKGPRRAELIEWLYCLQTGQTRLALDRWQQKPGSEAWLVAALISARAPAPAPLLAAAKALPPTSPAYVTAQYHRQRLLVEAGEKAQARLEIDALLAMPLTKSAANELRVLRAMASADLTEYLRYSFTVPITAWDARLGDRRQFGGMWGEEAVRRGGRYGTPLWMDAMAKGWNESTPLRLWMEALDSDGIPERQRAPFLRTLLVRAVLLKRPLERERTIAAILAREPKSRFLTLPSDAANHLERDFSAVLHILYHADARPAIEGGLPLSVTPGGIDIYFGNWWCAEQLSPTPWTQPLNLSARPNLNHGATYLAEADAAEGMAEWNQLRAAGSVQHALKPIILAYARQHPRDPRTAEALWRLIRATRYALCWEEKEKPLDALKLLERIAPGSAAVQQGRAHYIF